MTILYCWVQAKGKMNLFDKLLNEFPILKEEFRDTEEWEIHYKMERIAAYVNTCIKKRDESEVYLCFDIIERYLLKGVQPKLFNALNVSFCEPLLLLNNETDIKWFYPHLKPKLRSVYEDYKKYYNELYRE